MLRRCKEHNPRTPCLCVCVLVSGVADVLVHAGRRGAWREIDMEMLHVRASARETETLYLLHKRGCIVHRILAAVSMYTHTHIPYRVCTTLVAYLTWPPIVRHRLVA